MVVRDTITLNLSGQWCCGDERFIGIGCVGVVMKSCSLELVMLVVW